MMTLEQAQEIQSSLYWKYVQNELDYRISCIVNRLRTCNKDELDELQNDIQMLESFKRLPNDVLDREEQSVSGYTDK